MSNVITPHLSRRFESAERHLHLPATQDEIDQKLTELDDYAEDLSKPIEVRDVECEIVGIGQYLRMADLSREGELEKLSTDAGLERFLVDTGYENLPEAVRPYLDYRAIGIEYYAEHCGTYSPGGYVRRKGSVEQTARDRPALITLHLRTLEVPGITGEPCRLSLPATDEELDRAKAEIGVDHFTEDTIEKIEFGSLDSSRYGRYNMCNS